MQRFRKAIGPSGVVHLDRHRLRFDALVSDDSSPAMQCVFDISCSYKGWVATPARHVRDVPVSHEYSHAFDLLSMFEHCELEQFLVS